jgi:hypothetical protein
MIQYLHELFCAAFRSFLSMDQWVHLHKNKVEKLNADPEIYIQLSDVIPDIKHLCSGHEIYLSH